VIHLTGASRKAIWNDHYPGDGCCEVGIDIRGEMYVVGHPSSRILVADEMLHTLRWHPEQAHPGIRLEWPEMVWCPGSGCCRQLGFLAVRGNNCYHGAVLSFDTTSGRIIYRIGVFDTGRNAWWAQWPD
jgi:hypothetical protein